QDRKIESFSFKYGQFSCRPGWVIVESTQNPGYKRFSRIAWAVQHLTVVENPGRRWYTHHRSLAIQPLGIPKK
ncbi:hypothetical protein B296_00004194, partial [Ensete ventricosum]